MKNQELSSQVPPELSEPEPTDAELASGCSYLKSRVGRRGGVLLLDTTPWVFDRALLQGKLQRASRLQICRTLPVALRAIATEAA